MERAKTPSMEGRTIVRPDATCKVSTPGTSFTFNGGPDNRPARREGLDDGGAGGERPSMEGRTIVRPDTAKRTGSMPFKVPSMEGRTIVRPDGYHRNHQSRLFLQWRAGQSSARQVVSELVQQVLQWRAGQSSGQTSHRQPRGPLGYLPSMEGRTIVRPDSIRRHRPS